ncbi:hypothetical protein HYPDE_40143 [Hyphomicrobium denitrificans 1NES1]|uniref:Uncharacterized protein n=1 Tax=Hyphomicrobium denitrificans 1NES1 TaxID=670307 RepID=N0BBP8_9HYPH|nr:hypothetical protein [Hyphomicrobium denitrificans]AGK59697.1 hypothetical protein HYPDE_40143 [Hyphomicrobium denitrificans 1NES1]
MKIGDKVRVDRLPDGLPPGNQQLQNLFRGCLGKTFPIVKFDDGLVELHVGEVFGKPAEYHQIWLEPGQVKLVEA